MNSAQTRLADEIVVADNASVDDTAEVVRAAGARVVAETEPGIWPASARGYDEATGDLILHLGTDSPPAADWIERAEANLIGEDAADILDRKADLLRSASRRTRLATGSTWERCAGPSSPVPGIRGCSAPAWGRAGRRGPSSAPESTATTPPAVRQFPTSRSHIPGGANESSDRTQFRSCEHHAASLARLPAQQCGPGSRRFRGERALGAQEVGRFVV
ncbi:glycosyltransferase family A protein [Agromyces bauzanensis]|uniref:Glycosyltransferase 2-like domain-containing protein n=1 Tax=Agromyces bauzanensis TaxID=1308924 RepID=A0A917UW65_9MICO|nr:glycosyltransferase family A protein [Agromyces bauzanensis]GGJ89713.1 hypothetical protein GCM10011372_30310 [Agromyces bauzanensis]